MRQLQWKTLTTLFLLSLPAAAQTDDFGQQVSGQGWSTLSGRTVGADVNVVSAQVGWPGISASFLHGLDSRMDVGGALAFQYGEEGALRRATPGLRMQGAFRYNILDQGKLNLGVHVEPGLFFYFRSYETRVGFTLPVGLVLGVSVSSALMANAGIDLPIQYAFGRTGGLVFPILMGGGLEYFLSNNLAATFKLRMGPALQTDYRSTLFVLEALVGVAYKL